MLSQMLWNTIILKFKMQILANLYYNLGPDIGYKTKKN